MRMHLKRYPQNIAADTRTSAREPSDLAPRDCEMAVTELIMKVPTTHQAAAYLGLSEDTLRSLRVCNKITHYRI
jgi:hypothetical protein